ncbi:hypothetical protein GL282_07170 [Veillonella dispar]|uniref:RHS domain-containing protein n=1 Tax=Veillonella nakazawae TaxID=2682456 RepID=UPI001021914F|nr:hypothetical protein [Veillonella dispar]MTH32493.1 hypothetical protein [Veillonella dispar]MTH38195.1 hypothetical protein [Veillonella dispar]RYS56556.1 hypothetical protein EAI97_04590 [Veillonella dispar]
MINLLHLKIDFKASRSPYQTSNSDVKRAQYARTRFLLLRQPRRGSRQQTHYFHCDQIGIPREMTDKDGSTLKAWQFLQYPLLPLN